MKVDVSKAHISAQASYPRRAKIAHPHPGDKQGPRRSEQLFQRTCLAALLASCFDMAAANPTLPQVVNGQASFNTQGNVLTVTNSPNAIINWQNFSINPGEVTRFLQQNSNSSVLNRILGQNPSQILGALQSNGKVFLINPNGIMFGAGAQVDVNGLVASSLNISNADFLAGKRNFSGSANAGSVKNQGSITTPAGGQVFLLAPNVENSGIITSPKGEVILAAGHTVHLVDSANPLVEVVLSAPQHTALNLGQVVSEAGRIGIYGALVKQRGVLNANSAVLGANGKIMLKASQDALLEAGSRTMADGAGTGGEITVTGTRVGLLDDAQVSANGVRGGGTVLIGGDYQGKNPALVNASQAYVSPQASIKANALQQGDGGKVVVWADDSTQFFGNIAARGAGPQGNGGLVETSGKRNLQASGHVDAAAGTGGKNGSWLLDPSDVTISSGRSGTLSGGVFDPGSNASVGADIISEALNGGTDVTIKTSGGTGGTGLITVNGTGDMGGAASIINNSGGSRTLTLDTDGAIDIHAGASISGYSENPLNLTLRGAGGITIAGTINNHGGTTTLNNATTLSGTLSNGHLSSTSTLTSSGVLDSMILNGTINTSGNLFIDNDLTLADTAVLNPGVGNLYFRNGSYPHLATLGSGTVNLAGGNIYVGFSTSGQTLQIDNGVVVQGYGGLRDNYPGTMINAGVINANTSGQQLYLTPTHLNNTGTLKSTGGDLTIARINFANNGSIEVGSSGMLHMNSDMATGALGDISNNGGQITFAGTLDNSNGTLNIGAAGPFGGLTTLSGTIQGGILFSSDSTLLNSTAGTLDGVTVKGTLGTSGTLFVKNGLTLDNGSVLNLGTSPVYFGGSGNQAIGPASGSATINLAGATLVAGWDATGQTLHLNHGLTLQGYGNISQNYAAGVENEGNIIANTTAQTLSIGTASFSNAVNGSLAANNGSLSIGNLAWSNAGSISVASGATLNLDMDTTLAGLTGISRSGGTIAYTGKLDNTNTTLDIGASGPFGAGGVELNGATIKGGVLVSSDSSKLLVSAATFDGVTLSGQVGYSGTAFVKNGLTLASGADFNLGNGHLYFSGSGTQNLHALGAANIVLAGGSLNAGWDGPGQTLELGANLTLRGYGYISQNYQATLNNAATILADSTGQNLGLNVATLNNSGTMRASTGSLTIGPTNWSNSGSVGVNGMGVLNLNMDSATGVLGTIHHSDGALNYGGKLDNSSGDLNIGAGGQFGALGLSKLTGSIVGGTVHSSDSTALNAQGATLDGVTVSGMLAMDGTAFIKNGLTLDDGASLNLGTNYLHFQGTGTQHISSSGMSTLKLSGGGISAGQDQSGQTLVIDAGVTIAGHGSIFNNYPVTLHNQGHINANATGYDLRLTPSSLINSGKLEASTGSLSLAPLSWSDSAGSMILGAAGTIKLEFDSTVAGLGAINRSGGTLKLISHTLDNSSNVLDLGTMGALGGQLVLDSSATIKNGTLKNTDSTTFNSVSGTLDGVTISGNFASSGSVFVKNGLTLANGSALDVGNGFWYFTGSGTQHIATPGTASIVMNGANIYGGYNVTGQTLQIDSGLTLHGSGSLGQSSSANLINNGTIRADNGSNTLYLSFADINNSGTLNAASGTLNLNGLNSNNGLLDIASGATVYTNSAALTNNAGASIIGNGALNLGNKALTNNGSISPGGTGSVGAITLTGNYVQSATGVLNMDVGPAANNRDQLLVSGTASLNGTLNVNAIGGYQPAASDAYQLLTMSGTPNGSFSSINSAGFTGATADYSTTGSFYLRMPSSLTNTWLFDGDGNWTDASKWSLGHVPLPTEDVQVPDYSSAFTINLSASNQSVKSVVFLGNDKLAVSGGSLNFAAASSWTNGALDVLGSGVVNANDHLTVDVLHLSGSGILNLSNGKNLSVGDYFQNGGTLNGPGAVGINRSFNRTAGSMLALSSLFITQTNGTLNAGALSVNGPVALHADHGDVNIDQAIVASSPGLEILAPQGAINNTGGSIQAATLHLLARDGIGNSTPLAIQAQNLHAKNTGSGSLAINNSGANLTLLDANSDGYGLLQQGNGGVNLNNSGHAITIDAPVSNATGNLNLQADSIAFNNHANAKIDGAAGNVNLIALGAGGIDLPAAAAVRINGNGESSTSINLTADTMTLAGLLNAGANNGSGYVSFSPATRNALAVDTKPVSGALVIAPAALDAISASNISLNASGSGGVSFNAPLNLSNMQTLQVFTSSGPILVNESVNLSAENGYLNLVPSGNTLVLGNNGALHAPLITVQQAHAIDASAAAAASLGQNAGTLALQADHITLGANSPLLLGSTGSLKIKPSTTGLDIGVVANQANSGRLELLASELNGLTVGQLNLGDASTSNGSGTLNLEAPLNLSGVGLLNLRAGCVGNSACGSITQDVTMPLSAPAVTVSSAGGVNLAANNQVAKLAGDVSAGGLVFKNQGNLDIGVMGAGLNVPGQALELASQNGDVRLLQGIHGGALSLRAGASILGPGLALGDGLLASAVNGVHLTTQVGQLSARSTSGSGDIVIANTGALTLNTVTQHAAGAIHIENTGAMTVAGPVTSHTGAILLETHSPLTINGNVSSDGGADITLRAGASNSQNDNLVLGGSAVVSTSGKLLLSAGGSITEMQGSSVSLQATRTPLQNTSLPDVNSCTSNPSLPRCNEVLPNLSTCISNPAAPGCSAVLPPLTSCISNPTAQGCSVVLPTVASCTITPTAPGCSVVLPPLTTCISNPTAPGCSVVLPTVASCTTNPQAPGCSVVLPNLATCIATPAAPGCSVVLPTLATCSVTPNAPGCSVVLPDLAVCTATPSAPGCSVVLPTIASCTANPVAPGCSAVLPSVVTCTANPVAPGCSVVLPTIATCIVNPAAAGCSVVLPNIAACSATPALPGCSVVLPSLATCSVTPSAPGCSVVLPNVATCTATPGAPGCSVVLPNLATCTVTPTAPGCSVVLPNIATCAVTPSAPGCSAVLPSVATCTANPATPGCAVVLPSVATCTTNPAAPGCAVVLPTIATCTVTPSTPGCSAVLPSLASCTATPTLPGCSAVLPDVVNCLSNPAATACQVVVNTTTGDLNDALSNTIDLINKPLQTQNDSKPLQPASTGTPANDSKPDDAKKEEKKDDSSKTVAKTEVKKEEPTRKLYCN